MSGTKPCLYCGSEIAIGATVCSVCKNYQSKWRNGVVFAGGAVGLITLLVSGLAFTVDRLSLAYKNLIWQDRINVLRLVKAGGYLELAVANIGDGPIFISEIVITSQHGERSLTPILKMVNPNDILPETIGYARSGTFLLNETGIPPPELLSIVNKQSLNSTDDDPRGTFGSAVCIIRMYLIENGSELTVLKQAHEAASKKIVSEAATGRVGYFSTHSKKRIEEEVALTGVFQRLDQTECKAKPKH